MSANSAIAPPALILFGGVALLSGMDATIKHLSETNHTLIVTLGRYGFGTLFALAIWLHAGRPAITGAMWRAHWVRGCVIAMSATSFFWSLTVLPLVEAVTISFIAPLIVPFVASVLIGEPVRMSSLGAAALGFAGVVVAVQGEPEAVHAPLRLWGIAAVLFAAATFAVSVALMRARARADGAAIVGLLAALIPGLIVAGPAIVWAPPPVLSDWPYFLLMGVLGAAGMYLMASAYARAEAQQLAPLHYSELVWASAIGYFVFHEAPRLSVYLGAGLIIAACLYAAWDERRIALHLRKTE